MSGCCMPWTINELGDGQRIEQLNVAKTATTRFQVRFSALRYPQATLPADMRDVDQFVHSAANPAAPLRSYPVEQFGR